MLSNETIIAQRPGTGFAPGKEGNGPLTPQQREEQERQKAMQHEKEKEKNDNKPDPDEKQLSRRQRSRKLKKEEKERKKNYYTHQNAIQEPRVRYRMNKNEKRAEKFNNRKNAPWWRKFQFNHQKRKLKRK